MVQYKGFFVYSEWKRNNAVDFGMLEHLVPLSVRTFAEQHPNPLTANSLKQNMRVGVYTEYDAVYSTRLHGNATPQIGVNNISDTLGDVIDYNSDGAQDFINSSLYSYNGRSYFA